MQCRRPAVSSRRSLLTICLLDVRPFRDNCTGDRNLEDEFSAFVDAWALGPEDWEALISESRSWNCIQIRVERTLLSRHSTYFRSLLSNFREAAGEHITVKWDLPIFCILLKCIHGSQPSLSPAVVEALLEGAAFFGVESAVSACEHWAALAMRSRSKESGEDPLVYLPAIWNTAKETGVLTMVELCVEGLAINFGDAVSWDGFLEFPFALLKDCIDHPQLTVESERQLCEALLHWCESQAWVSGSAQSLSADMETPTKILKQVRLSLLPLEFVLGRLVGRYPLHMFDISTAGLDINSEAELLEVVLGAEWGISSDETSGKMWGRNLVLRLTQHLQVLDLSGCPQITVPVLFSSAACAPPVSKQLPAFPASSHLVGSHNPPQPDISFETLEQIIMSQCWRIKQEDLVTWLRASCPRLLLLMAPHCPQLDVSLLLCLSAACPLLEVADLSVDQSFVEPKLTVEGPLILETYSAVRELAWGESQPSLPHLMELSLRGRMEVSDDVLSVTALCCPCLRTVDLSGCTTLSDAGIASFLKQYRRGFQRFLAAGTSFGPISSKALIPSSLARSVSSAVVSEDAEESLGNYLLVTLDLEKCTGLNGEDVVLLLKMAPSLRDLSLAYTCLSDEALFGFSGTHLLQLNLRETQVSGGAIAYILARNRGLKSLNIRGCQHAATHSFDLRPGKADSNQETLVSTVCGLSLGASNKFQEIPGEGLGLEEVTMGWGLSDSSLETMGLAVHMLRSLTVGIGGTLSNASLLSLSHLCPALGRLSLCFQTVSDEGLIPLFRNLNRLHTLELQHCIGEVSPESITALTAGSGSSLTSLRLERVTPWMGDKDLSLLSKSCKHLRSLSLLGCQMLTADSLRTIADRWRGLTELKLEDCNKITSNGALCLLHSCQALQVIHFCHTGKGLPSTFISDASMHLPLLRRLAIDLCDAMDGTFATPRRQNGKTALKVVNIMRCRGFKHVLQPSLLVSPNESITLVNVTRTLWC